MKTFEIENLEIYEAAPPFTRQHQIIIDACSVEEPPFSIGTGIFRKGEKGEIHAHAKEVEAILFTKGSGIILIDGTSVELKPNLLVYIHPGETHQVHNTGEEVMEFLFICSPPGPESDIRKWKSIKPA